MSSLLANLAASPFVNQRPVQRFKLAAWVVGALLAALNGYLWLQYRHDSTAQRARLAETRAAIEAKSRHVVEMDRELAGLGLAAQNAQVDFLNHRIAERTFPWSLLFERVAATLPDGVRLLNLSPVFPKRDERPGKAAPVIAPEDEMVGLKINGVAKSDQELYELIDAFFASPFFERPRLYQEARTDADVKFNVEVQYRPRLRPDLDPSTATEETAEGDAERGAEDSAEETAEETEEDAADDAAEGSEATESAADAVDGAGEVGR